MAEATLELTDEQREQAAMSNLAATGLFDGDVSLPDPIFYMVRDIDQFWEDTLGPVLSNWRRTPHGMVRA